MNATRKPSTRGPGRQRGPAREDLRDRLLDIAVRRFAHDGIAATTLAAIAREAGVTAPMVHYHFATRDQLLDAVVDMRLKPLIDQVMDPALTAIPDDGHASDLARIVAGAAQRMVAVASATPWFPTLWIREIAAEGGQLRERVFARIALERATLLVERIARAQAAGAVNAALQPPLVMVSVIGLAMLPLATRTLWGRLPHAETVDAEAIGRHVAALLLHGVGPAPASKDNVAANARRKARQ
ncbi:TetR/AcrR family transcriptional regulator [Ralstonia solanacearum]|uniref:TetR family transcriptional regulator n=1 Tax=Ralstonia solanacearum K60 TaxID=1091042 RepID=A0AAP8D3W6_RALSL|nr:TetR/AcrR family transcriptional regulator [Ralstonia solanacearum]MBT1536696.1 TetR/AcrR family transcriptional regulator [Ralstonia solanacearum]OYQ13159.1 TetR family transcriptional regulator [Ralstonia solanacearum K60]QOK83514.1 TetR/AcrR family transcriptional regulator [Ralstonia solanacearum]RIJ87097.1 TetR/AcrR family transcriptional regulator [Ralstonia solanacearum]CCF97895.1 putative transcriptional regulator protein, tetR family) [Ralstonia solanacearum K60]